MDTDALRAHIRSGPQGPRIGAFFDFDGTIIDGYSASTLYRHRFRARQLGLGEAVRALKAARGGPMTEQEFETFLTAAICGWTGRPQSYLDTLGEHVYREGIAKNLFHEAWRVVKAHQRAGHTVVIASSATRVQISTMARELGITHILCTELQVVDGVVTGRLAGRTLWGDGKEAAIRTFARRHRLPLANAYGYANGGEDIPFLGALGHPYAVNPQPALARAAALHGWPVLAFQRGTARLDPRPLLRTGGMWATLVGAGAAGVAMSVLSRDRQRGIDLMLSCFAQVGAAVGDVRVKVVRGHGHLCSHRPAVFLINHQSALIDLLVGATVLREGVTALASKEIGQMPIVGPMIGYPQVVFRRPGRRWPGPPNAGTGRRSDSSRGSRSSWRRKALAPSPRPRGAVQRRAASTSPGVLHGWRLCAGAGPGSRLPGRRVSTTEGARPTLAGAGHQRRLEPHGNGGVAKMPPPSRSEPCVLAYRHQS